MPGGLSVFGEAIDVAGNVIVIGDNTATDQFANEGVARVYEFDGNQWNLAQKLTGSDADVAERFGWSVATDGNEVAIGADKDDSLGSVYVFEKQNGTWTETARLRNSQGLSKFGDEVALQNGTLLAGTEANTRAFEFRKVRGVWTEAIVHDQAGADRLAVAIAIDDGRAILGSPFDEEAYEFAVGELRFEVSPANPRRRGPGHHGDVLWTARQPSRSDRRAGERRADLHTAGVLRVRAGLEAVHQRTDPVGPVRQLGGLHGTRRGPRRQSHGLGREDRAVPVTDRAPLGCRLRLALLAGR